MTSMGKKETKMNVVFMNKKKTLAFYAPQLPSKQTYDSHTTTTTTTAKM